MSEKLEENQHFWRTFFRETSIIQKFMAEEMLSASVEFNLKSYGKLTVSATLAVPLGTNFLSDVYTVKATLENGTHYSSFVKVKLLIFNLKKINNHYIV